MYYVKIRKSENSVRLDLLEKNKTRLCEMKLFNTIYYNGIDIRCIPVRRKV